MDDVPAHFMDAVEEVVMVSETHPDRYATPDPDIPFERYYMSESDAPFDPQGDVRSQYVEECRHSSRNVIVDYVWRHVESSNYDPDYAVYLYETFTAIILDSFSEEFESMMESCATRAEIENNSSTANLCGRAQWHEG